MQGHESPEIDRVLRESLGQLSGPALIGVIGTIGQRRTAEAVPDIVGLVDTTDAALTEAIVVALGQIGGAEALEGLIALEPPTGLEPLRYGALLRCADGLAADGAHREALGVYRRMTADALPTPVRVAAWRGRVRIQQARAVRSFVAMLQDEYNGMRLFSLAYQIFTGQAMPDDLFKQFKAKKLWKIIAIPRMVRLTGKLFDQKQIKKLFAVAA